jgi:diguanylate cyclase (GGDEF)-like protein
MRSSSTERVLAVAQSKLEPTNDESAQFAARQRLMNTIGQDLTSLSNRESLLQRASCYLKNDLSYPHARLRFVETGSGPQRFHEVGIRTTVECGGTVLGAIVISGTDSFTETDREILRTFSGFLAVALSNVKRLEDACSLATTDPLTGIANRRKLFEVGVHSLRRDQSTGVIVFDIDHFKAINDALGHFAGDMVLKAVVERAKECVRKTDLLIRYGGDEFVILLPQTGRQAVREIAERLRSVVQRSHVEVEGRLVATTISVGFVCLRGEPDLSRLIGCADRALLAAKQHGRNMVCGSARL